MPDKKKLLVISGGGIFGYVPAYLLSAAEPNLNAKGRIDYLSGTSVGGIISLMLADARQPVEVLEMFHECADEIFYKYDFLNLLNPFRPIYGDKHFNQTLMRVFGVERRLKELGVPVIIPTVNFSRSRPKVYETLLSQDADQQEYIWEVARKTASAPVYFPPFAGFIDGGLFANTPVVEAAFAINSKVGVRFEDMDVFIIGTGCEPDPYISPDELRGWSKLKWIKPLLTTLTKSNEARSMYLAERMGFNSLRYFNPAILDSSWRMDDVSLMPMLRSRLQRHFTAFETMLEDFLA